MLKVRLILIDLICIINAYPFIDYDERIVNGFSIEIEKVPYQVAFYEDFAFSCGGSIISENYVLTAAHCIGLKNNFMIQAGSTFLKEGGSYHSVIKVIVHEDYDPETAHNDIALLKVSPEFPFDEKRYPISLGTNFNVPKDTEALVTGWGTIRENGPLSRELQAVKIPVISHASCQEQFEDIIEILESQICAGFAEGGKDACQGDSGGPFVINGYLVGVVSLGVGCARPSKPGVYTRVASYLDWIEKNAELEV